MKLSNSIAPLEIYLQDTFFNHPTFNSSCQNRFKGYKVNPRIVCAYKALRYDIWHALPTDMRDHILSLSVSFVGGYAECNDSHIDTLLKKVLTDELLNNVLDN